MFYNDMFLSHNDNYVLINSHLHITKQEIKHIL